MPKINIMSNTTITLIAAIVSLLSAIGAIITVYTAFKKAPHESKNIDADTVTKWQALVDKAADQYKELSNDFDDYKKKINDQMVILNNQVATLIAENNTLKSKVLALEAENTSLKAKTEEQDCRIKTLEAENKALRDEKKE